jgi:KDO2-lipid IV(A) lauroyltransferase
MPVEPTELAPSLPGILFYWVLPIRRRVILANLRQVFGDKLDARGRRRLAQCFYSHLLRSIREYFTTSWTSRRRQAERVDIEGIEHLFAAEKVGKGILVLTGHFGNWELASVAAMLQYQRYRGRFHVIRKSLSAGLERLAFGRFRRAGLKVLPRYDALGAVLRALENNDVAIFILDQHTKIRSPRGIGVEFFGKIAGTSRSLALVAGHSGAPVIPATSYRKPDGRHVLRFEAPLAWIADDDPTAEQRLNTRRYNEVLERFVLEHPDQWFWMHRRWKNR